VVGAKGAADVTTPGQIADLAATGSDLLRLAAESSSPLPSLTAASLSLDRLNTFLGQDISADTRSAFLNAVRYKDNTVTGTDNQPVDGPSSTEAVNSFGELKAIATSYAAILGHANGSAAPAPSFTDYSTVGLTWPVGADTGNANALALLNSAVARNTPAALDSLGELNALASIVTRLLDIAAIAPDETSYPPAYPSVVSSLTPADLGKLGLTGVTAASLPALLAKVATTADDGSSIQSAADLQALADAAKSAQALVQAYAQTNTGTAPTAADYAAIGLELPGADAPEKALYLNAVNAALASVAAQHHHRRATRHRCRQWHRWRCRGAAHPQRF
jgi:hypothetical protein